MPNPNDSELTAPACRASRRLADCLDRDQLNAYGELLAGLQRAVNNCDREAMQCLVAYCNGCISHRLETLQQEGGA